VPPGAADLAGPLQQDEVVDAGLAEPHGQAEAGEPRPHDGDLHPPPHASPSLVPSDSHRPAAFQSRFETGVTRPRSCHRARVRATESARVWRVSGERVASSTTSLGIANSRTMSHGGMTIMRAMTPRTRGAA